MSVRPGDAPPESDAVEIRPLTEDDLPGVLSLERSIYGAPWRIEHFARLIDLPAGMGWVAVAGRGEVVGYALGWVTAEEAEIANIAVAAEWRRSGIGARLLRTALDHARARGARRVYLEVRISNAAAQSFYRRFGFQVVGRRPRYYTRPTEDAYMMAVDLSPGPT